MNEAIESFRQKTNNLTLEPPISQRDQIDLCSHYERSLLKGASFSHTVKATAITFFKRFYLHQSVLEFDPKEIFPTCLFLATKTENEHKSLDEFCSQAKLSRDVIVALEFTVAEVILYHFSVFHAYIPLHGIFLDLQGFIDDAKVAAGFYDDALKIYIDKYLCADAMFLYQPAQIALSCFWEACSKGDIDFVEVYLKKKYNERTEELVSILEKVKAYVDSYVFADLNAIKKISTKVKTWKEKLNFT